jgi:hypothetical protein
LREIDDAKDAAPFKACSADERGKLAKVHGWLSAADPSSNYQQALKLRQHNTGLWLLKSGQYQAWKTEPASFLWIHGIPGSGKTTPSSTILQEVLRTCHNNQEKAVLYFYFDFNDSQKQDAESMLRSLICQLLRRFTTFPSSHESLFLLHENNRQQSSSDELLKSLRQLIQGFAQTFVVLDALDECSQRSELMEILTRMGEWQLPHSHVVVTSRRERDIEGVMHKISSRRNHICLESKVIDKDIRQYIRQRLSDDTALNKWGKDIALRQEIETALIEGSRGMYVLRTLGYPSHIDIRSRFRWAACQLDALGKCRNRATLRKSLATLPLTLQKSYDRILHGITEEDSVYAIRVLRWLTFAERPVTIDEIAEIAAIDVDRDPPYDEEEVLEDPMEALDICSSLVSISTGMGDGKEGSSIQVAMLAHYSVKEYFLSDRIRAGQASRYSMQHSACHSILARSCLGYLEQISPSDLGSNKPLQTTKLVHYCAEFWMKHAEEAGEANMEMAQVVARFLSAESTAYLKWLLIYDPEYPWKEPNPKNPLGTVPHPLYYAALFGLADVVELLLERGADANAQGGHLGNALRAAAGSGHEGGYEQAAKHLINAGADVNSQGGGYGSTLGLAIGNEDAALVELLLENGADVALNSHDGEPPLNAASFRGHIGIVKLLLSHGADVSATNDEGWTPVNSAAAYGHFEVAKLLIENGANVTIASSQGWRPISSASDNGHLDLVRLLLDAGADVSIPSPYG